MLKNYLKIAFRNLVANKGYSAINIGGLAMGMAVAMLIGLWIYDELSFDKGFENHDRIGKVMQQQTFEGKVATGDFVPIPLSTALKNEYAGYFDHVILSHGSGRRILTVGEDKLAESGYYVEPEFSEMLPVNMLSGKASGLNDPLSIMLSESLAKTLFGTADPLNKIIKIDNKRNVTVAGVYQDFPRNSYFKDVAFLMPFKHFEADQEWVKRVADNWNVNSFEIFVQLAPKTTFAAVSDKIRQVRQKHVPEEAKSKPEVFLNPMDRWHLYSEWENGVEVRGRIQFVWLFGINGAFVLLLACINFMNLSTAQSEKRAKEVGIRKAVGSVRSQLIGQFFSESFLVVALAFVLCMLAVVLALPTFNEVADKSIVLPTNNPVFWLLTLGFCLFTGLVAGSYPAVFLSSIQPVKILKGATVRLGRFSSMPRKVLVVLQFTVSVTLIIGTLIVFRQIQFVRNRPIGYDRNGLVHVTMNTPEVQKNYAIINEELLRSGAVTSVAESSSPTTGVFSNDTRLEWDGKDPNMPVDFNIVACTHDFGKTVNWKMKEGRDFDRAYSTDTLGLVINESAIKYMGIKDPVGKEIRWGGLKFHILGVIKDIVTDSPFEPVKQTVYFLNYNWMNYITMRLNPNVSAAASLARIEPIFKRYNPASPFLYNFISIEHDKKFKAEERIGKLSSFFATLAVLVSCLGLFGLASYTAQQRKKEIGVRKVLGASVANLWALLSKEFILLVVISCVLAAPIAFYVLDNWLKGYAYHAEIPAWVFAASAGGALFITLLTVSFQAIKAALANPVKSLRSE
ncbi:ABC transporter permease [Dyadobacter luticola]|uniref:FtsX-like permease family protein n=1 Tax=Dyadobacter luticola TaxID=1979387 RepID=A0A5R9KXL0_9BACT|nr:ABC transporter permease [Dyadobacter luticola]TLV01026.1 FtsX-like permease family protein [Dyadobacter luticola]